MRFLFKGRQKGKSTELVKISAEKNIPIICVNDIRKRNLLSIAEKHWITIPTPITVKDISIINKYWEKSESNNSAVLIDDAEEVFEMLLKRKIDTVAISIEDGLEIIPSNILHTN